MALKKTIYYLTVSALFLVPFFVLFPIDVWPFNWAQSLFFPFITGKAFFFRILVQVAFAGWLLLALMDEKYRPRWTPITIVIFIFTFVALLADLLGVNPMRSLWSNFERMEGWIAIVHLFMFFLSATNVFGHGDEGKRMWYRWFNVSLFISFIVGIYGVMQLTGNADIHQGSTRITASLGNAAYLAVYLLWHAGLAFYMFVVSRTQSYANKGISWIYLILSLFLSYLLFETATRGTILGWLAGVVIGIIVYLFAKKKETDTDQRKMSLIRWVSVGIISVIVLFGALVWINKDSNFVQNNEVLRRMTSISVSGGDTVARLYIWNMALTGWMQKPVLGWGQENFNYIFNANYNPKMWSQEQWFDRAHSVYLDWLTAAGIIGLLTYLALYVLLFVGVWKSSLRVSQKSVLTGVLVGYAIHNMFVFDNIASYIMFFAAMGFINSFEDGRPIGVFGNKPLSRDAFEYVAMPVVIIILAGSIWFYNARPIMANNRLISALTECAGGYGDVKSFEKALAINVTVANQEIREHMLTCFQRTITSSGTPENMKVQQYELAKKNIQDQINSSKWQDARIYSLGGYFMDSIGQTSEAQELLETAHELSPRKQSIITHLATLFINSGQVEKAVDMLKDAYESAPEHPQVRATYALGLIVQGREDYAKALFGDDSNLFDSPQMAQAYVIARKFDKAIPLYEKLLKQQPESQNLYVSLAQAYYAMGDKQSAFRVLRKLAEKFPQLSAGVEATIEASK